MRNVEEEIRDKERQSVQL